MPDSQPRDLLNQFSAPFSWEEMQETFAKGVWGIGVLHITQASP